MGSSGVHQNITCARGDSLDLGAHALYLYISLRARARACLGCFYLLRVNPPIGLVVGVVLEGKLDLPLLPHLCAGLARGNSMLVAVP